MSHHSSPVKIVVAGIFFSRSESGRVQLLVFRRSQDQAMAGSFEFPGGKLELNETLESGLVREFKEELGISIKVLQEAGRSHFKNSNNASLLLVGFLISGSIESITLTEHDEMRWITQGQLNEILLLEPDVPIARAAFQILDSSDLI